MKKVIRKRVFIKRGSKHFVRWKNYEKEFDEWKNLLKLKNVINLMKKYKNLIKSIYLFDRLKEFFTLFISDLKKSFVAISSRKKFVVIILFKEFKNFFVKRFLKKPYTSLIFNKSFTRQKLMLWKFSRKFSLELENFFMSRALVSILFNVRRSTRFKEEKKINKSKRNLDNWREFRWG